MPSSYTQSLRLILPVTGELTGTWGDAVNAGLTELVEDAIAGSAAIAMANANVTLTTANEAADQARNMFLNLTGANTAQRDVIVPAVSKLYFVHNGTTGGFGVQVKTAAGTGVVVPNGQRMALYCDGTDVLFAFGSSVGRDVLLAADAAAARTTLDVPSRGGGDASGTWPISITGNAATLDGVAGSGYVKKVGDTMTGNLVVNNANGIQAITGADYILIRGGEGGTALSTIYMGNGTTQLGISYNRATGTAQIGTNDSGYGAITINSSGVSFGGSVTVPTAAVTAATAGSSVGGIGTYAYLYINRAISPGGTASSSELLYAGEGGSHTPGVAGTWRAMGVRGAGGNTMFLRIA